MKTYTCPSEKGQSLQEKKPRLWRSSPAAHIPWGFALISCRLMYWQSRALGELGRAGANPPVTCRVFPLSPSRSVWFSSSATQSDTSEATPGADKETVSLLTPLLQWLLFHSPQERACHHVMRTSPSSRKSFSVGKMEICAEIFGFHNTKRVVSFAVEISSYIPFLMHIVTYAIKIVN